MQLTKGLSDSADEHLKLSGIYCQFSTRINFKLLFSFHSKKIKKINKSDAVRI